MFTYQSIIDRLTESQRIRLLTNFNSLSDPALAGLGVPTVTVEPFESIADERFPTLRALARSWDRELMADVVTETCRRADPQITCLAMPGAKAAVGAVHDSLAEDPLLTGEMAGALLKGVQDAGLNACMEGYGTHRRGARNGATWSSHPGRPVGPRVLEEQLVSPFTTAISAAPCLAVLTETDMMLPVEWKTIAPIRVARSHVSDQDTVRALERGEILLEGSAVALQSALHTYRRLRRDLERGKATMEETNAAMAAGEAISEETVHEALERLLSFAGECAKRHTPAVKPTEPTSAATAVTKGKRAKRGKALPVVALPSTLTERACAGSTVLLENSGVLPLKSKTKFCIIGEAAASIAELPALSELYQSRKCTCIGYAQGYPSADDRNDGLLGAAAELARQADVILLFLSAHGYAGVVGESLPAGRIALFDRLSRLKKRMVVILDADDMPDIQWLQYAATPPAAVLLAPLRITEDGVPVGLRYTVETLFGTHVPAGRLTATLVDPTDPAALRGRLEEGPFLGYRYYDLLGTGVRYPFGHGLSYSPLLYAALAVHNGEVSFKVTNKGTYPVMTVSQVYIGMQGSAVLRPQKELMGYAKLTLAPGETQTVKLPLALPAVVTENGPMTEAGHYTVSVGESVSDIRLTRSVELSGETIPADGLSLSDYLPSVSNIFKDHYTLEAEYTPMKASLRNPLFGFAALILAAIVKIVALVTDIRGYFPDILAAVLAVGAIVFLIMEQVDRKRQFAREQKRLEEINNILYADAKKISAPTAEELFAENPEDSVESLDESEEQNIADNGEYDHFADVDASITFASAACDLCRLAGEKGLEIDIATANSIFAAIASSRLIVVKGMSDHHFRALHGVLCEYFGCPTCVDQVDAGYVSESAVVLGNGGPAEQRGMMTAILSAQDRVRHLHIAALTDVRLSDISQYFVPFAAYARAPFSANILMVQDRDGRTMNYRLPENLWFMLHLKGGESLADIPDYIAEVATVHTWKVGKGRAAERCTEFHSFYYGQLLYLTERAQTSFVLDEDVWKKIDRLETFVARHGEFRIGNKLWLGMETYLAVLAAVEAEVNVAIDEALSVKLLPAVIHTLAGKLARDDQGLGETLDVIFGDDRTTVCRKTIKESGADIM